MRLLRFQAPTTAAAMALIRNELGAEALILSTRRSGGGVEVTAAVEPPDPATAPLRPQPRPQPEPEPEPWPNPRAATAPVARAAARPGEAGEEHRGALLARHGVPRAVAARLAGGPLAFALSAALRFAALPLSPGGPPLLLVGPPGAGKTLTVARLATRLVLAGTRPLVATTDGARAGAAAQLDAFTRLLGLDLQDAATPEALARAVARRAGGAPALIDTAGIDCFDRGALAAVADLAAGLGAQPVAVLAAGGDAEEMAEMAAALAGIGARLLVATRLDLARRLGGTLAAAAALSLAELGLGSGAADGLVAATPGLLARRLARALPPAAAASPAPREPAQWELAQRERAQRERARWEPA